MIYWLVNLFIHKCHTIFITLDCPRNSNIVVLMCHGTIWYKQFYFPNMFFICALMMWKREENSLRKTLQQLSSIQRPKVTMIRRKITIHGRTWEKAWERWGNLVYWTRLGWQEIVQRSRITTLLILRANMDFKQWAMLKNTVSFKYML